MVWTDTVFAVRRAEPVEFECSASSAQCVPIVRQPARMFCLLGHLLYEAPRIVSIAGGAQCVTDFERMVLSTAREERRRFQDAWESVRSGARWERLCRRWASKHTGLRWADDCPRFCDLGVLYSNPDDPDAKDDPLETYCDCRRGEERRRRDESGRL